MNLGWFSSFDKNWLWLCPVPSWQEKSFTHSVLSISRFAPLYIHLTTLATINPLSEQRQSSFEKRKLSNFSTVCVCVCTVCLGLMRGWDGGQKNSFGERAWVGTRRREKKPTLRISFIALPNHRKKWEWRPYFESTIEFLFRLILTCKLLGSNGSSL